LERGRRGRATAIEHPSEIAGLEARNVPRWTGGDQPRWMRLHPQAISGRRLPTRPGPSADLAAPVVASLPAGPLVTMPPEASLADVGAAMVRHGVSVVLVGDVAVTQGDLTRAVATGLPTDVAAREHSGRPALALGRDASVVDAALAMVRAEAHHLVVIDTGRPVAMVTLADTLAALLRTGELPAWLGGLRLALHVPR